MKPHLAWIERIFTRLVLLSTGPELELFAYVNRKRGNIESHGTGCLCLKACFEPLSAHALTRNAGVLLLFRFLFKLFKRHACSTETLDYVSLPFGSDSLEIHKCVFIVPVLAVVSDDLVNEVRHKIDFLLGGCETKFQASELNVSEEHIQWFDGPVPVSYEPGRHSQGRHCQIYVVQTCEILYRMFFIPFPPPPLAASNACFESILMEN